MSRYFSVLLGTSRTYKYPDAHTHLASRFAKESRRALNAVYHRLARCEDARAFVDRALCDYAGGCAHTITPHSSSGRAGCGPECARTRRERPGADAPVAHTLFTVSRPLATPSTAVQVWFVCEIWTLTDSALDPLQGGAGPRSRAPRSPAAASGRSVSSRPRRDAARARARRACPLGVSGDAGPKEMRHASERRNSHSPARERQESPIRRPRTADARAARATASDRTEAGAPARSSTSSHLRPAYLR